MTDTNLYLFTLIALLCVQAGVLRPKHRVLLSSAQLVCAYKLGKLNTFEKDDIKEFSKSFKSTDRKAFLF